MNKIVTAKDARIGEGEVMRSSTQVVRMSGKGRKKLVQNMKRVIGQGREERLIYRTGQLGLPGSRVCCHLSAYTGNPCSRPTVDDVKNTTVPLSTTRSEY